MAEVGLRSQVGVVVPIPTFLLESTTNPVPPTVRSEEKRFVEDAVVEKKLVVVAEVPVAFEKVKFWKVEEALARILVKVPRPEVVIEFTDNRPLAFKERAAVVEVAVPATVVVEKYKFPPAFLNAH